MFDGGIGEWIIGKILSNAVLGPILKTILGWQKNKLDAIGSHEAQVESLAAKSLELERREAEVNAAVVIAEQGNWFTRSVRPAIGWSVVILLWKIFVWDKALGEWTHGRTDPLDPNLWSVIQTVLIAYFGGRTVEKTATMVKSIFGK